MCTLKQRRCVVMIMTALLTVGLSTVKAADDAVVAAHYPELATGALAYAKPADLPDGVLLKAEGVEITLAELEKTIAEQPMQVRAMLQKEPFYVLEQEAAGKLLVIAARKALDAQGRNMDAMSDDQLIGALFEEMTQDVTASEDEQRAFYKENPHFFHGAPFDRVQPQIAQYLAQQKKQQLVEDYIKTLGRLLPIEVAGDWTKQQAMAAKDNPLDKARQGGTPTVALFYAASPCCPDSTASDLDRVATQYGSRLKVVTLNPNTDPILAARYQVRGNPALLFYDAEGKEVFRQQGAMSRDEITAKLAQVGIQ